MKKVSLEHILKILSEEAKRIKKKKNKFSPVAIAPIRRPMGSIFSMDVGVSMAESINENENKVAIKPITKKFDYLKWKLNDFQKQFLDDFINIPAHTLKEKDYQYASNRTGIPVSSIKSISNTYGTPEVSYVKPDVIEGSKFNAAHVGPKYSEFGIEPHYRHDVVNFKKVTPEESREMKKTPMQKELEMSNYDKKGMAKDVGEGGMKRLYERELPPFMYEWVMYYIEGTEEIKVKDTKVLERAFASRKTKYVSVEFEPVLEEGKNKKMDYDSNKKTGEIFALEEILKEFNSTFGTNFIVEHQFVKEDGKLKIAIENFQNTDGKNNFNKKKIEMPSTDKVDPIKLAQQFKDMTLNIKSLYVDWNEFVGA